MLVLTREQAIRFAEWSVPYQQKTDKLIVQRLPESVGGPNAVLISLWSYDSNECLAKVAISPQGDVIELRD